jgi:hypothetical protein
MPLAVAAPLIGGAIAGGGSILSGILGSNAASTAAKQQEAAQQQVFNTTAAAVQGAQANIGAQVGIANQDLGAAAQLFNPYVQQGQAATNSIQNLISGQGSNLNTPFSFTQADLQNSPGYNFTLQQGQQAIQRAAAAQGGLFSSGTLKSLAGYTTGTAEQYFNDAYNQALGTYNTNTNTALQKISSLQNIANLGYSGTSAQAGIAGQQAANSITGAQLGGQAGLTGAQTEGGALTAQGNAAALGTIGSTNALTQGIAGATNAIGSGANTAATQSSLQALASLGVGTATTNPYAPTTTGTASNPSGVPGATGPIGPTALNYTPATSLYGEYGLSGTQGGGI